MARSVVYYNQKILIDTLFGYYEYVYVYVYEFYLIYVDLFITKWKIHIRYRLDKW